MQPKQWKLILALALLVVAGGVYWRFGRSRSAFPSAVSYVCVETGKTYRFSQAKLPKTLPGKSPDTGRYTLVPLAATAGDKPSVDVHYAHLLNDPELAQVNQYVDPESLEVRSPAQ